MDTYCFCFYGITADFRPCVLECFNRALRLLCFTCHQTKGQQLMTHGKIGLISHRWWSFLPQYNGPLMFIFSSLSANSHLTTSLLQRKESQKYPQIFVSLDKCSFSTFLSFDTKCQDSTSVLFFHTMLILKLESTQMCY